MEKHSRLLLVYMTMTCDNQELHKKYGKVDGNIIMHKLPKHGVKAAWINAILNGRKQVTEEYFWNGLPAWFTNQSNPSV